MEYLSTHENSQDLINQPMRGGIVLGPWIPAMGAGCILLNSHRRCSIWQKNSSGLQLLMKENSITRPKVIDLAKNESSDSYVSLAHERGFKSTNRMIQTGAWGAVETTDLSFIFPIMCGSYRKWQYQKIILITSLNVHLDWKSDMSQKVGTIQVQTTVNKVK